MVAAIDRWVELSLDKAARHSQAATQETMIIQALVEMMIEEAQVMTK